METITCGCQHLKLLNKWYAYRSSYHQQCPDDQISGYSDCDHLMCLIWRKRKIEPQFNKATYFGIENGHEQQHSGGNRPHRYTSLEIPGLRNKSSTQIHHACDFCIDKHPLKAKMVYYKDGMKSSLVKTRNGLHRVYTNVPSRPI